MKPTKRRRQGRDAFFPGGDPIQECPANILNNTWEKDNWIDGWNQSKAEYEDELKEREYKDQDYIRNAIKNAETLEDLKEPLLEIYDLLF